MKVKKKKGRNTERFLPEIPDGSYSIPEPVCIFRLMSIVTDPPDKEGFLLHF